MGTSSHRHSWFGEMVPCGKTHKDLGKGWTCEHWTCKVCGKVDPSNYNQVKVSQATR